MVLTYSHSKKNSNMKTAKFLTLSAVLASALFFACSKENSNSDQPGTTRLKINMTDAPLNADSVNVDIQQVRVNFRNDTLGWVDLNTTAGIYNLLGLQNGLDTLLAAGTVPTDTLQQIRLVLGTHNSIVVGGVNYCQQEVECKS
jgi:hypothetical protein